MAAILPVDERHRLAADRHSWAIQRCVKRKHRKARQLVIEWRSIMWFPNVQQAVQALAELRLRTSDAETVADALVEVERITAALCNALQPKLEVRIRDGPKENPDLDEAKPGEKNTNDFKRTTV